MLITSPWSGQNNRKEQGKSWIVNASVWLLWRTEPRKDLALSAPVYIAKNIVAFKRTICPDMVCLILGVAKQSNSDKSMLYKTMVIHQLGAHFLALTQGHCPWSNPALIFFELCQKTGKILFITIISGKCSFPSGSPWKPCSKLVCCFSFL